MFVGQTVPQGQQQYNSELALLQYRPMKLTQGEVTRGGGTQSRVHKKTVTVELTAEERTSTASKTVAEFRQKLLQYIGYTPRYYQSCGVSFTMVVSSSGF